jgi:hypothetical protein
MNMHLIKAATTLALLAGTAQAQTVIADWTFGEAATTKLNLTTNSGAGVNGPGSTWDVAITGVAASGTGLLNIANNGNGGSGTRTSYANFGPAFDAIGSGTLSLYARLASWNLAGMGTQQPSFTLALIEGNDFSTAEFTVAAAAGAYTLRGGVDAFGNGAPLPAPAAFATFQPLTVRLDVDLGTLGYTLAYDSGAGFVDVGSASVDSFTQGVNSLRLGLSGDFTVSGLAIDRIWVVHTPTAPVPEPDALALMLAGSLCVGWMWRRQRGAS